MRYNRKEFLKKLTEILENELELAERGIFRAPEGQDVRFPVEHKVIETLLQLLGYGRKRIYVPSPKAEERELIEKTIISDYQKGINVFSRHYTRLLKGRIKELGIGTNDRRLQRILNEVRKALKSPSQ